jgi:diamine N-acetyltransferase
LVELRPPSSEDLPVYSAMLNDAALQAIVLGPPISRSTAEVQEWLDEKLQSDSTRILSVDLDGQCVGYVQIANIDWVNGVGTLGICLLSSSRGSGVGSKAVEQLHDYARRTANLRKMILTVRADNAPGIALFEKIGYRRVGAWTDQVRVNDDKYVDIVLMEQFLS